MSYREEMGAKRYRAFLSYSHADMRQARDLHRRLEAYALPKDLVSVGQMSRPLAPVFRDREDLAAAPQLRDAIEAALADADALVVACSPASAASPYVNQEIETFLRVAPGVPVFAIRVSPEQALPPGIEAARQRGVWDGTVWDGATSEARRHAVLQLAAARTGQPAALLQARDAARRRGRFFAGALVLSMGIVTLAALGLVAVRREAAAQRSAAGERIAKARATELRGVESATRDKAEEVVAFMLDDLQTQLIGVSQLAPLEHVARACLGYYQGSTPTTRAARIRKIKALLMATMIASLAGEPVKGRELSGEAVEEAQALVREAKTSDPELDMLLSLARTQRASLALQSGIETEVPEQPAPARRSPTNPPASNPVEPPASPVPADRVTFDLTMARTTVPRLQMQVIAPGADLDDIRNEASRVIEGLASLPDDEFSNEHAVHLASVHFVRGVACIRGDKEKDAVPDLERSIELYVAAAEATDNVAALVLDVEIAKSHLMLADALEAIDAPPDRRLRHAKEAKRLADARLDDDPNHGAARELRAHALSEMGTILKDAGDPNAAAHMLEQAASAFRAMMGSGAGRFTPAAAGLIDTLVGQVRLCRDEKRWAEAIDKCNQAIQLLEPMVDGLRGPLARGQLALRTRDLAKLHLAAGDRSAAKNNYVKYVTRSVGNWRQAPTEKNDTSVEKAIRSFVFNLVKTAEAASIFPLMEELERLTAGVPCAPSEIMYRWNDCYFRRYRSASPEVVVAIATRRVEAALVAHRTDKIYVRAVAMYYEDLSVAQSKAGSHVEALESAVACRAFVREHIRTQPDRAVYEVRALCRKGEVLATLKPDEAGGVFGQAMAVAKRASDAGADTARTVRPVLIAGHRTARWHRRAGRVREAAAALTEALDHYEGFVRACDLKELSGWERQELATIGSLGVRLGVPVGPRAYGLRAHSYLLWKRTPEERAKKLPPLLANWGHALVAVSPPSEAVSGLVAMETVAGQDVASRKQVLVYWKKLRDRLSKASNAAAAAVSAGEAALATAQWLRDRGEGWREVFSAQSALAYRFAEAGRWDDAIALVRENRASIAAHVSDPRARALHVGRTWGMEARFLRRAGREGVEDAWSAFARIGEEAAAASDPNARTLLPLIDALGFKADHFHFAQGQTAEGERLLETLMDRVASELPRADPATLGWQFRFSLWMVADDALRHDLPVALRAFEARVHAFWASGADPTERKKDARTLAKLLAELGDAATTLNDVQRALAAWDELEQLVRTHDPDAQRWWRDKRRHLEERRGDVFVESDPQRALAHYGRATRDREALAKDMTSDKTETRGLVVMYYKMAGVYRDALGDSAAAGRCFDKALRVVEQIEKGVDPDTKAAKWWTQWRERLAAQRAALARPSVPSETGK